MAGVIFVGQDGEDHSGHGDDYDYDRDHHSPLRLGASIHRGKVSLSAVFRGVAAHVAGLR